jgi:hypothetical protein
MRAQKVFAGRLARCPACGDNVVIPGQREDAGRRFSVDTRMPIPRERPADAYGDVPRAMTLDDDEDDEVVERPRKRRPKRRSDHDGSKALVWVGLGLLLFTSLGAVAAATCWVVITPDSGSETTKTPPPPGGGVYAIQPPQPTRAAPVTLYIPPPEVGFPAMRPEVSAAKRGNSRTGR